MRSARVAASELQRTPAVVNTGRQVPQFDRREQQQHGKPKALNGPERQAVNLRNQQKQHRRKRNSAHVHRQPRAWTAQIMEPEERVHAERQRKERDERVVRILVGAHIAYQKPGIR